MCVCEREGELKTTHAFAGIEGNSSSDLMIDESPTYTLTGAILSADFSISQYSSL